DRPPCGTFQIKLLFSALGLRENLSGRSFSRETPFCSGPRQCDQVSGLRVARGGAAGAAEVGVAGVGAAASMTGASSPTFRALQPARTAVPTTKTVRLARKFLMVSALRKLHPIQHARTRRVGFSLEEKPLSIFCSRFTPAFHSQHRIFAPAAAPSS